jgi:hypothetical protein
MVLVAAVVFPASGQGQRSAHADDATITCAVNGSFTASPGVTTAPGTDAAQGSGTSVSCFAKRDRDWAPRAARVSTTGTLTGTCSSISGTLQTTVTWIMRHGPDRTSVLDWSLAPGSSMIAATGSGTIEPGGLWSGRRVTVSISSSDGSALDCAEGDGDTGQSDQGILTIL